MYSITGAYTYKYILYIIIEVSWTTRKCERTVPESSGPTKSISFNILLTDSVGVMGPVKSGATLSS